MPGVEGEQRRCFGDDGALCNDRIICLTTNGSVLGSSSQHSPIGIHVQSYRLSELEKIRVEEGTCILGRQSMR